MADSSVVIKFGADISGLASQVDQASAHLKNFGAGGADTMSSVAAAVNGLTTATQQLAVEQVTASASSESLLGTLRDIGLVAASASVVFQGLVTAEGVVAGAASGVASGIAAIGSAALSGVEGLVNYAASLATVAQYAPIVSLANTGIVGSFGRLVVAVQDWLRAADIYRSGVVAIEGATIAAAGNMTKFQEALKTSGYDTATNQLQHYTEQLAKIPGMTNDAAAAIIGQLGSIQNFSGAANQALIDILPHLSKTSDDAKALAGNIANAFGNPLSNGKEFLRTLGGVDARLEAQFEAASRSLNVNKAQAAFYDSLINKVQLLGAEKTRETEEELRAYQQMGPLGQLLELGIHGQVQEAIRFNVELDKTVASLQKEADAIRSRPLTGSQVSQAAAPIIASQKPAIDEVEELTTKLDVLYREREKLQNGASPFGALATPESARELERNREAADALADSLRKLQATRKGGSATELLENTQAQARARFALDESAAALALAASLDKESSETKNLAEASALAKRAAQERQQGEELAAAAAEARARRSAAAEEEGSAAQVSAILKANAARRAVTQPNSAEFQNLAAADEAARRSQEQAEAVDAQAVEDSKFRIAQAGFAARAELIKEEASTHKISATKETADLISNLSDAEAAEKAHQQKIEEIWGQGTTQYRAAQLRMTELASEEAQKRAAI